MGMRKEIKRDRISVRLVQDDGWTLVECGNRSSGDDLNANRSLRGCWFEITKARQRNSWILAQIKLISFDEFCMNLNGPIRLRSKIWATLVRPNEQWRPVKKYSGWSFAARGWLRKERIGLLALWLPLWPALLLSLLVFLICLLQNNMELFEQRYTPIFTGTIFAQDDVGDDVSADGRTLLVRWTRIVRYK